MNPIEYRAVQVSAIKFPQRTIDLIVMPYESETMVQHQGRMVREVISRGAFKGIETRPDRVPLNRDHNPDKLIGRVQAFHPNRHEGLVAECKVGDTLLGDETLQLASEDMLDASAGFAPMQEQWDGDLRRVVRAYLDHVALTPTPAYRDAKVLAVRTAPEMAGPPVEAVATPNLDLVRGWALQERYDRLGR